MSNSAPPGGDDPSTTLTYSPKINPTSPPDLRLLHYNDVYHVDASSSEPVGGFSRFQTLCNHYRNGEEFRRNGPELLTFFSGDAFNPSLESSVTKGSHMVPLLNNIGTDVACVGNHDLDFGVKQFRHLAGQCKFPWLLANVLDPALGDSVPIGNAQKTVMLTASNGIKIGVIGLGEREWLDTINSLPPDIIYKSASETAKELVPGLREQGADLVVALTHQREPNDDKLAKNTPEGLIDLVLGGHDHYYDHSVFNGTHVLRSGTDFKQLSYIEAWRQPDGRWEFRITRRDVTSTIEPDQDSVTLVEKLTAALKTKLEKPIGYTAAGLDARFRTVRLKESNLGNFVADLMRFQHHGADCCIMAAGTIRGDQIYPPGVLRLKDMLDCFPFEDPVVVVQVKGKAVLEALENAVSKYPALEGRFPQVSNIEFEFDPELPPGKRVTYCTIGDKPVDLDREYVVATRGYMARGKDGYDSLLIEEEGGNAKEIVSEENGVLISTILRQYFLSLKVVGSWRNWSKSLGRHWDQVQTELHGRHPVVEPSSTSSSLVEKFNTAINSATAAVTVPREKQQDQRAHEGIRMQAAADQENELSSDDEDEGVEADRAERVAGLAVRPVSQKVSEDERRLVLMRKVMRKWWRLAGLRGSPALCDKLDEGEFQVSWTKAIAPRLEGRIRIKGIDG